MSGVAMVAVGLTLRHQMWRGLRRHGVSEICGAVLVLW